MNRAFRSSGLDQRRARCSRCRWTSRAAASPSTARERIGRSLGGDCAPARRCARRGALPRALPAASSHPRPVMAVDPLRVVIDARSGGISGHEARRLLFDEHAIHTEMATDSAIVAVIGAGAVPDVRARWLPSTPLPDTGAAARVRRLPSPIRARRSSRCGTRTSRRPSSCPPSRRCGRVSADALAAYPARHPERPPGRADHRRNAGLPAGHGRLPVRPRPRRRRPFAHQLPRAHGSSHPDYGDRLATLSATPTALVAGPQST